MPDEDALRALLRKGTIAGAFVPVLCGSAFKNKGVQPLLDAVNAYLPSPLDVPPMKASGSAQSFVCHMRSSVPADDWSILMASDDCCLR